MPTRTLVIRLNAVLLLFTLAALGATAVGGRALLQDAARHKATTTAQMLLAAASAVREYTVAEVKPLLEAKYAFAVQTVSSYAAHQTIGALKRQFPDFSYREAALNPTNPDDRAVDWESELIRLFRDDAKRTELVLQRAALTGETLVIARPLRVEQGACLDCHTTPARAPADMTALAKYKGGGGYGWTQGEVVGAQIVTVPLAAQVGGVDEALGRLLAWVAGACALLALLLNATLLLTLRRR